LSYGRGAAVIIIGMLESTTGAAMWCH